MARRNKVFYALSSEDGALFIDVYANFGGSIRDGWIITYTRDIYRARTFSQSSAERLMRAINLEVLNPNTKSRTTLRGEGYKSEIIPPVPVKIVGLTLKVEELEKSGS